MRPRVRAWMDVTRASELLCVSREQILEWIRKGQKVGKGETG